MRSTEIDRYLDGVPEPGRTTLQQLRDDIHAVAPDVDECISYAMPGFRRHGRVVAGFAAFTNHLSYFPHSGATLGAVGDAVKGYSGTKSALHFDPGTPLPRALVRTLIDARTAELAARR